jgi:hypothetical protein
VMNFKQMLCHACLAMKMEGPTVSTATSTTLSAAITMTKKA